ncbi:MAG TPA: hypothetical protein VGR35_20375 [Tepidisphaeraceae bacterium]|nr:hypothetical protein [Tepidisphaeraceae bacterium]
MRQDALILLAVFGLVGFGGCARSEPPRDAARETAALSGANEAQRDSPQDSSR